MKITITESKFIALVSLMLAVIFSFASCNSPRYKHGLKDSDFNPDHREEALDILDYVELEQYLNSL
jgi:hypothetical protein